MGLAVIVSSALDDYGQALRTRWRWVAWAVLLSLSATVLFLLLKPPLYRSEATVFVRTPGDVSRVLDGGDSYAQARARTYAALTTGTGMSASVIADLGLGLQPRELSERIKADNPQGTALIDIAVDAPSAAEATRTATVLLSEQAAMVRSLESVPGALVPRAELITVNPPGPAVRVAAWGAPIPVVLLTATLVGLALGAIAAVMRSTFALSVCESTDARWLVKEGNR